ncbi:hypothetical protein E3O55_18930 [Cryobacterium sp. MDB1-18-2]|uniref:hypothetical protein n=1 Tax=unclassified Cryobacterium TaxID=2649013 RepID=UPI00106C3D88|nr:MULTISPECIES: hypothetical protein [unclassified Cryobacterium]TFC22093.1 hypothetical protein E3O55_18930 [Cryobacterium sp. MDB1-18-2]TFC40666.1 hypothetical protein E3O50_12725 [Cryobacterium sp. MDB1-18-1]
MTFSIFSLLTPGEHSDAEVIEQAIADDNFASQKRLIRELRSAQSSSGRADSAVAALLGIATSELELALSGSEDLSLSELAELAQAVDARIEYVVRPNYSAVLKSMAIDAHFQMSEEPIDLVTESEETVIAALYAA